MARKAFVVDQAMRAKVRHLAGVGVRQDDIAKIASAVVRTSIAVSPRPMRWCPEGQSDPLATECERSRPSTAALS